MKHIYTFLCLFLLSGVAAADTGWCVNTAGFKEIEINDASIWECEHYLGKVFSSKSEALAEHKRQAESYKASDDYKKVWCATQITVSSIYKTDCEAIGGKIYSLDEYDEAVTEHKRLKQGGAPTADMLWCANAYRAWEIEDNDTSRFACELESGNVFSSESDALAEHKRKSESLTPAGYHKGYNRVWCVTESTVSSTYGSDCVDIGGKIYSIDEHDDALAEHKRKSELLDDSGYNRVWCITQTMVSSTSGSHCIDIGGKIFSKDEYDDAVTEHKSLNQENSSSEEREESSESEVSASTDIAYCHNSMLQQFYSASDGICFSSDMEITEQEFTNRQLDSSRYSDVETTTSSDQDQTVISIPDWDSPEWIAGYSKYSKEYGIELADFKFAEQWGVMDGIRLACGAGGDGHYSVLGKYFRAKGYEFVPLQMAYVFAQPKDILPSYCETEEAIKWVMLQSAILRLWETKGVEHAITDQRIKQLQELIDSRYFGSKESITRVFDGGTKYVGEVKNGKAHGQGTYTYPDGRKYVGEWKDNKYHGQGTFTFPDGSKYVGEWKDSKYHGQGTFTFAHGDKYVGEYKDGKSNGQGTYTWLNGNEYVGEVKDGKKHGQGTYTLANGGKYVGEYKDGKAHGQGTYTSPDGSKYVGEYAYGQQWKGVEYSSSGQVTSTWENGQAKRKWTTKPFDSSTPKKQKKKKEDRGGRDN